MTSADICEDATNEQPKEKLLGSIFCIDVTLRTLAPRQKHGLELSSWVLTVASKKVALIRLLRRVTSHKSIGFITEGVREEGTEENIWI